MLFKYLAPERTDILDNLRIRFTQPAALNDPFESRPRFTLEDEVGHLASAAFEEMDEELRAFLDQDDLSATERDEARQLVQRTKAEISDRLSADEARGQPDLVEGLGRIINQSIGVLSLSKCPDNLQMWAHYGDQHQGFVIGLDEGNDFFHLSTSEGAHSDPRPVIYHSHRETLRPDGDICDALLCTKSLEWSHEQEVRVLRVLAGACSRHRADALGHPVVLFDLPAEAIGEVILGARSSPATIDRVQRALQNSALANVQIKRASVSFTEYALELKPFELEAGASIHGDRIKGLK